jgi:2-polyprenyl-6-methoxyphenol hydroxylase-like FAD-dependent oxidoreductase
MAMALFLKRHNIECDIYEARDEAFTSGGNIALAPNALRVLDHLGLFDRLRTLGYNYDEMSFTSGSGVTLGLFLNGSQSHYNFQAIRIHRTAVRDIMREELKRQGITIQYEKKCTGIIADDPKARCVDIEFEGGEKVTASFVIGADGIHSHIRKHVAPSAGDPYYSGLMGVMGTVMAENLNGVKHDFVLPSMLFGSSGSFAIMPASFSGDEVGYFATLEIEDQGGRQEWDAFGKDKQKLYGLLQDRFLENGKWPDLVTALCKKTPPETLTSWPYVKSCPV